MADWSDLSVKAILEVKQRIQTVVIYQELDTSTEVVTEKEAIVDSFDRPIQATYT